MNKRVNFYFAALLGTMSPLCAVPALASNSTIATATQQENSCTGTVLDATGDPLLVPLFALKDRLAAQLPTLTVILNFLI